MFPAQRMFSCEFSKSQLRAGGQGSTRDEMVGWHHRLNGPEFEETPGDGEGQGNLACCSPRGRKESDTTEQLNNRGSKSGSHHPNHQLYSTNLGGFSLPFNSIAHILKGFRNRRLSLALLSLKKSRSNLGT